MASDKYAIPASRQAISTKCCDHKCCNRWKDRLRAILQKTEYLWRYACLATARTVGVHSHSLSFRASAGKGSRSGGVCCFIGLPKALGTRGPDIYLCLCRLCRQRGCQEWDKQGDSEKRSQT
jgi:hypothetical protein